MKKFFISFIVLLGVFTSLSTVNASIQYEFAGYSENTGLPVYMCQDGFYHVEKDKSKPMTIDEFVILDGLQNWFTNWHPEDQRRFREMDVSDGNQDKQKEQQKEEEKKEQQRREEQERKEEEARLAEQRKQEQQRKEEEARLAEQQRKEEQQRQEQQRQEQQAQKQQTQEQPKQEQTQETVQKEVEKVEEDEKVKEVEEKEVEEEEKITKLSELRPDRRIERFAREESVQLESAERVIELTAFEKLLMFLVKTGIRFVY